MAQPLEFEQAGYNSPDGLQVGRTTSDLIGFYGTTPIARYATVGAASTYLTTTLTTSMTGFTTLADMTSFMLQVSTITQALRGYGLIT